MSNPNGLAVPRSKPKATRETEKVSGKTKLVMSGVLALILLLTLWLLWTPGKDPALAKLEELRCARWMRLRAISAANCLVKCAKRGSSFRPNRAACWVKSGARNGNKGR